MATRYADLVDPQVVMETIPGDYANQAKLIASGVAAMEPGSVEGTRADFIKETLFESEDEGQAIGVDGEITLKDKTQTLYHIPVFFRADGALLDDIADEITSKTSREATLEVSNAVQRKSTQMMDSAMIHALEGCGLKLANSAENYLDTSTSALTLSLIQKAKATRNDEGAMINAIMVMRSLMWHYLCSLGLVANDSNTMTQTKRDEILIRNTLGTLLGMDTLMTDKLSLAGDGDYYSYLVERGAIRLKSSGTAPQVDPIIRTERGFQDIVKFRFKMGCGLAGMSWSAAATDVVTNTDLATYTNWARAKDYAKNVPLVVIRCPAPTIS